MRKLLTLLVSLLPFVAKAKSVSGIASYYAEHYEGRTMANGQKYRAKDAVMASWAFPLGTKVKIEYTSRSGQKRSVEATVSDRGPAQWVREADPRRKFDLSYSLFKKLETPRAGLIEVVVTEVKS